MSIRDVAIWVVTFLGFYFGAYIVVFFFGAIVDKYNDEKMIELNKKTERILRLFLAAVFFVLVLISDGTFG